MRNRIELVKYFKDLGFTKGAEIGVFDGRFSEVMLDIIPNLELLSIDSWEVGKIFPKKKIAVERLAKYPLSTIMHMKSTEAAEQVEDESLDFCFIDGEHSYKSVKEDVEAWAPKVRVGGIVSGHDFYKTKTGNTGVIDAINEFTKNNNYELQLTDWDKGNPVRDDRQPSWFFVKTH